MINRVGAFINGPTMTECDLCDNILLNKYSHCINKELCQEGKVAKRIIVLFLSTEIVGS